MFRRGGSLGVLSSSRAARAGSWCTAVALSCGLILVTSRAAAEPRHGDDKSQIAHDLFERGKAKWSAAEYEEAAGLLAASNLQSPRGGTLMLLADAYERLGRLRSARDCFEQAGELARRSGESKLEYRANTRAAALLSRLPEVEVRVGQPIPGGLLVTLNGVELPAAQLNVATALDAGGYYLEARAPGYQPFSVQLQLANAGPQPSGVRVIAVTLVPEQKSEPAPVELKAADPAEPARDAEASGGGDALAWWVGGTGGALVVASVVSMIVSLNANSESHGACGFDAGVLDGNENACTKRGVELRDRSRLFANLATVTGVVGIAGLGTGLTLHFTSSGSREPDAAWVSWSAAF
jgi:hypothetical protein